MHRRCLISGRKNIMSAEHTTGETTEVVEPDSSAHMTVGRRQTMTTTTTTTATATTTTVMETKTMAACSLHTLLGMSERMELRQIELIYRAEGNANLVLALPQFKKVLRLPKMPTSRRAQQQLLQQHAHGQQQSLGQQQPQQQQQQQQRQQHHHHQQHQEQEQAVKEQSASEPAVNQNAKVDKPLTMADYGAYIELLRHLLGAAFVPTAEVVAIAEERDRLWINAHIRPARPAHRRDKEFCGQFGLLLPDATQLPGDFDVLLSNLQSTATLTGDGDTYAIEIKPKQGWLLPSDVNDLFCRTAKAKATPTTTTTTAPTSTTSIRETDGGGTAAWGAASESPAAAASAEATPIPAGPASKMAKTDTRCRYCTMQLLKLANRKISKVSAYCPIELFSGNASRMLAALQALFECPQNNLRVFRNGNLIYGDHMDSLSLRDLTENIFQRVTLQLIKQLLVMCLLGEYDGRHDAGEMRAETDVAVRDGQPATRQHSTATVAVGRPPAPPAPASHAPTTSAKDATAADVNAEALPSTRAQLDHVEMLCLPKDSVLRKILHLQLLAKHNLRFMHAAGYAQKASKSYAALAGLLRRAATSAVSVEQLAPPEAYLLGATALDCSIMLAFREVSSESSCRPHVVRLPDGRSFLTKITLLDLDPKPDSHFHKYVRQTCEAEAIAAAAAAVGKAAS